MWLNKVVIQWGVRDDDDPTPLDPDAVRTARTYRSGAQADVDQHQTSQEEDQ
jgi:hypothetical protein